MNCKYILPLLLSIFISNVFSQGKPDHNLLKGLVAWKLQKYDTAINYFNISPDAMKHYPSSFIYYGISLLESGQPEMAINEFLKAEKSGKGSASFWLAKVYAKTGDTDKALEYLEINLKSGYKEPERVVLLDKDLQKLENENTWKVFWKNYSYYSSFDNILSEADYLISSDKLPEALALLNENLNKSFRKSPLYAKRSIVYSLMNNYKMAFDDVNRAIEGDRRNMELIALRADLSMKQGKYKSALEDYETVLKADPYRIQLYLLRAEAKNHTGLYEPAIEDMKFYLFYLPEDHSAWYRFGMLHFSNQKYLNALECFNKALQIDKSKSEYFEARGETFLRTRTYRYASNDFSMALDINPDNPKTYLNKGIAVLNIGNIAEACFCFERAKQMGVFEADEYLQKHCKSLF